MISFIHAGDVHLGNSFTGLSRKLPEKFQQEVQEAGFTAFEGLINLAVDKQVDFVLFPGDLLNGQSVAARVQATLMAGFLRLKTAGIKVLVSFGNHDYAAFQSEPFLWPDNVNVFDHSVQEIVLEARSGERVAFVGFSYADRVEHRDRLADYPVKNPNVDYEVGLYHGSVGQVGDDYAAFSIDSMLKKHYDYWALGHIHQRELLHEYPSIAYSGNLQGLNRTETGLKGVLLVQSDETGLKERFVELAPVRFETESLNELSSELDLISFLLNKQPQKTTFLSLNLGRSVAPEVIRDYQSGVLLEKLQQALPKDGRLWPIAVDQSIDLIQSTRVAGLPSIDFMPAIQEIVSKEKVLEELSEDVPLSVRTFFNQPEGRKAVEEAMILLFSQGGTDDEN